MFELGGGSGGRLDWWKGMFCAENQVQHLISQLLLVLWVSIVELGGHMVSLRPRSSQMPFDGKSFTMKGGSKTGCQWGLSESILTDLNA